MKCTGNIERTLGRGLSFALGCLVVSANALGGDLTVGIVQIDNSATLEGFVTSDISVTTPGDYVGSALKLALQGEVFQAELGGNTALVLPPDVPPGEVEFDAFLTHGDSFFGGALGEAQIDGPVFLLGDFKNGQLDTQGISATWSGATVPGAEDFPTACVTLSDDAEGSLQYGYEFVPGGAPGLFLQTTSVSGAIQGGVLRLVPEPAAISVLGLMVLGGCIMVLARQFDAAAVL